MKRTYQLTTSSILWKLLLIICLFSNCNQTPEPEKLEILFLGHNSKHHDSEAYLPLLTATLSPKGINFTYTADLDDLNESNLKKFDGLAIYANHDSISSVQEKALLQFVKRGGGLIPIHCASYCFRNSDEYVNLVGGQFKSHETGVFSAQIIDPDHPAMEGLTPFESWDETYVHHFHNQDHQVLMERVEGDHREPYTWAREYGKGRMFYTALGHDERTWSEPGFHALLENGILWAVGEKKRKALAGLSFPTLEYSDAKIPNYEKRDPPPRLQTPLNPEESQKLIQVPPDFELQLFASEPDIFNPMSMAWDEKGRLWILETKDYPNEIQVETGLGNDRIKILEDTDGDGKADKFTVFADKLSVPTSLTFSNGGLIVSQAPHFLFLKDTDGDDQADERRIIMDGWGTFDTHAGPSNLQYGFDNWIWGVLGYSGFEGKVGDEQHKFSQGIYRFKPDGSQLEFMGATSNNTWGLGFSETFDIFASTANNTHSAYLGIPQRYYLNVEGLQGRNVKKIDGHYAFHPITRNFRQVDVFGGFTAAAGHHLYTARDFPKEYWNRIALVCEPTGHLLHHAILEKEGAGFREKDGWNLLSSADEWVSPVHAEVGPDGAVWILDWYNFIIQHNPTPPGFENGPGNAHINPLRDRQHGRIYRLVWKGAEEKKMSPLNKEDVSSLIAGLRNDNMGWRMHAQRLLVERDKLDVIEDLITLVKDPSIDEIGLNSPAVHALWTLHGLDAFEVRKDALAAVNKALQHKAGGVRKAALQVMPKNEESLQHLLTNDLVNDPDQHTRLAAITSLSDYPTNDKIGSLLYQLIQDRTVQADEHLATAVYLAAVKHKNSFIETLATSNPDLLKLPESRDVDVTDWPLPQLDDSNWGEIGESVRWNQTQHEELQRLDGVVWFRKEIDLAAEEANKAGKLYLGPIDDSDVTYLNGRKIGGLTDQSDKARIYSVPKGVLRQGRNVLAIRITDKQWRGGMYGPVEDRLLEIGQKKIPLAGPWKFKIESITYQDRSVFAEGKPVLEVFLENYGPYAVQMAAGIENEAEEKIDQQIVIRTIKNAMKYDLETFNVTAGSTVEIIFENDDLMQHNLLILQKGSLEKVGKAADELATQADGPASGYVPEMPEVLSATVLVEPGTSSRIVFKVPDTPGDYPFVCTFPGHWRTMNGVMKVRAENL